MLGSARHRACIACGLAALMIVSLLGPTALTAEATAPPPLDENDGSDQLTRGTLANAELPANDPRSFTFVADGPGVLTLAWTEPGKAYATQLLGPDDRSIKLDNDKQHGQQRPFVRSHILPLTKAGTYTLRLTAKQDTKLRIGCAWMPFEQLKPVGDKKQDQAAPRRLAPHHDWLEGLPDLPVGTVGEASNGAGIPRSYRFKAKNAGLLTVVIRAKTEDEEAQPTDITLQINDDRGQSISGGVIDENQAGDKGAEQAHVGINRPGNVQIIIHPLGGGEYWYAGSWLDISELAVKPE